MLGGPGSVGEVRAEHGLPRACVFRCVANERGQTGAPISLRARTSPAFAKEGVLVGGGPVRATHCGTTIVLTRGLWSWEFRGTQSRL